MLTNYNKQSGSNAKKFKLPYVLVSKSYREEYLHVLTEKGIDPASDTGKLAIINQVFYQTKKVILGIAGVASENK